MSSKNGKLHAEQETPAIHQLLDGLDSLSKDELRERFEQAFKITCDYFVVCAQILRHHVERGWDAGELVPDRMLRKHMLMVAHEQLLPGAATKLLANPIRLRAVAKMTIPDQKRIAEDEPIHVLVIKNGSTDPSRSVPPSLMTSKELAQVFASDHIRDDAEQAQYLRDLELQPDRASVKVIAKIAEVDAERGLVTILRPGALTKKEVGKIWRMLGG